MLIFHRSFSALRSFRANSRPGSQLQAQSALPRGELSGNRAGPAIAVILVLAGIALLYLYDFRLRASPAFAPAMNLVSRSAEAKAALGEPIRAGAGVRGAVRNSTASGYAVLAVPVSGPKGKGTLYVVANRLGSDWDIEREVLLEYRRRVEERSI